MRAVVQRVKSARVSSKGHLLGAIGPGLLVYLGVHRDDDEATARKMAGKVARLRIFADEDGKMNLPVAGTAGSLLAVSQFTLCADSRSGNRPSFALAAPPDRARPLFDLFTEELRSLDLHVETGEFGAMMEVESVNDGPVTIWLDSGDW